MTKEDILNAALFDVLGYSASMGEDKIPSNENIQKEYNRYLQAMQEYADLRCKPLVEALVEIINSGGNYSTDKSIAEKALQGYNKK